MVNNGFRADAIGSIEKYIAVKAGTQG